MSILENLINEASGGHAKFITATSPEELALKLKRALEGDSEDCGESDCPVHGEPQQQTAVPKGLSATDWTPDEMRGMALAELGEATLACEDGNLRSAQVKLLLQGAWLNMADVLERIRPQEEAPAEEPAPVE